MPRRTWPLFLGLVSFLLTGCGGSIPTTVLAKPRPQVSRRHRDWVPPGLITPSGTVGPVARVVYLTIDDGPSPVYTPQVLRILRQNGVPATFFLVGTRILAAQEVAREIYDDGETIGNHSFDHVYKNLYHTPLGFLWDVERNQDLIKRTVGVLPELFRAPGGTVGNFVPLDYEILRVLGLHLVGWNVDAGDARQPRPTPAAILAQVARQLGRRPYLWSHAIILLHDFDPQTVQALPGIIRLLKANGFPLRESDGDHAASLVVSAQEGFGWPDERLGDETSGGKAAVPSGGTTLRTLFSRASLP